MAVASAGHIQVCTSLQADKHASTPLLSFLQAGCPSCHPTNSVKALKAIVDTLPVIKKQNPVCAEYSMSTVCLVTSVWFSPVVVVRWLAAEARHLHPHDLPVPHCHCRCPACSVQCPSSSQLSPAYHPHHHLCTHAKSSEKFHQIATNIPINYQVFTDTGIDSSLCLYQHWCCC